MGTSPFSEAKVSIVCVLLYSEMGNFLLEFMLKI